MTTSSLSPQIDSCKYILMRSISETDEDFLKIVVREARDFTDEETAATGLVGPIEGATLIDADENSRTSELIWKRYVAVSVRNESYAEADETANIESGRLLRIFRSSNFLRYVSKTTFAEMYPEPLIHVEIACLNHIIDVVSTMLPVISLLGGVPPLRSVTGNDGDG